jgi:hypothetical protein
MKNDKNMLKMTNKKDFIRMLSSSLEELIKSDVLCIETKKVYNPYSDTERVKSVIRIDNSALKKYLKTV